MRTNSIIASYIAAGLFAVLAIRAYAAWNARRETRASHLALATGIYAVSRLISAISGSLYDTLAGEAAPRWITISSGLLGILGFYFFIRFLFDFIPIPRWVHGFVVIGSLAFAVLTVVERSGVKQIGGKIVFSASPISFTPYLYMIVGWYLVLTGILWVSFGFYAFKTNGLARFRMLSISLGFLLFFLVIGILPLILIKNSTQQVRNLVSILGYVLLVSAPLLLVGFSPPRFITRRFGAPDASQEQAAS